MTEPRTSTICGALLIAGIATATGALGDVNSWTRLGPYGGTVSAVAIDPQAPTTLWAATPAGVFKSTDAGANWVNVTTLGGGGPLAVAAHPTIEGTVFVVGVWGQPWKTTDGGTNWTLSAGGLSPGVSWQAQIVFKPGDPSVVYLVRAGGIFRSTDGGSNWAPAPIYPGGRPNLVVDPKTPANLWILRGGGIIKSSDGGDTWARAEGSGLPSDGIFALAADPTSPADAMYAVARPDGEINFATYKSTDGAATFAWMGTSDVLTTAVENTGGVNLLVVPGKSDVLYASGGDPATYAPGLYRSADSGGTWTLVSGGLSAQQMAGLTSTTWLPDKPNTVYASLGEGLYATTDAGATWQQKNTGLRAMDLVYPITFAPTLASTWYFTSPNTGVFRTTDSGRNFTTITNNLNGTVEGPFAIDPTDPLVFYTAGHFGNLTDPDYFQLFVRSADGGNTWQRVSNPSHPSGVPTYLQPWGLALLPTSPTTVYVAAPYDGVFKSTDGGVTFLPVNSGLPTCPAPYDACTSFPEFTSIVVTNTTGDHLVVANESNSGDDPYLTTDGGASWTAASGMPAGNRTFILVTDPSDLQTVYAGTSNGVFTSTDGGATWSLSSTGVPSGSVYGLAIDLTSPPAARTIYASGLFDVGEPFRAPGVYVSTDNGRTWSVLNNNYGLELNLSARLNIAVDPANHQHLILSARGGLLEMTREPSDPLAKGVTAPTESQVPSLNGSGTGDGNGDGIQDTSQSNVASLPNSTDGGYVTIAAPTESGVSLSDVAALPSPAQASATGLRTATAASAAPPSATFPDGLVQFSANDLPAGGCVAVTLYFPKNPAINAYLKYGPTIDNTAPHWYNFTYDGATGAEIFQDPTRTRVVLHLCDGLRGDSDVTVNGVISDPGGPAILQPQGEPIPTLLPGGVAVLAGLLALVGVLLLARRVA